MKCKAVSDQGLMLPSWSNVPSYAKYIQGIVVFFYFFKQLPPFFTTYDDNWETYLSLLFNKNVQLH